MYMPIINMYHFLFTKVPSWVFEGPFNDAAQAAEAGHRQSRRDVRQR